MAKRKPAKPKSTNTGSLIPETAATPLRFETVSNAERQDSEKEETHNNQDKDEGQKSNTPQNIDTDANGNEGNVTSPGDVVASPPLVVSVEGLPAVRARPGETRNVAWERIRQEARTAGLPRGQGPGSAYEYATKAVEQLFQPPEPIDEPEPVAVEPEPIVVEEPAPVVEPPAVEPVPASDSSEGLAGLGDIPADWPSLPDNAALPVEVQWVQANRVRVRAGNAVDLSRARTPAPSAAALAWLETAILFPSKWADITAKATSSQVDEAEHTRRERLALSAVGELLSTMADATT
jgi:hypothetical protein